MIQDIIDAVNGHHIPLHMAVELSSPGVIDQLWSSPWKPNACRELLILTRLDPLIDALESFATVHGIASPEIRQQVSSARHLKNMKARREWARTLFMTIFHAMALTGRAAPLLWNVVKQLGPPTLDEIVEASMRP